MLRQGCQIWHGIKSLPVSMNEKAERKLYKLKLQEVTTISTSVVTKIKWEFSIWLETVSKYFPQEIVKHLNIVDTKQVAHLITHWFCSLIISNSIDN